MKTNVMISQIINFKPLYLVFSLFTWDFIDVLSVCRDEEENLYLCKITDWRDVIEIISTRTTKKIIKDLINQKISINIAMKRGSMIKYKSKYHYDKGWTSKEIRFNQIDRLDLAADNTYLEYPNDGVKENYRRYFKEEL